MESSTKVGSGRPYSWIAHFKRFTFDCDKMDGIYNEQMSKSVLQSLSSILVTYFCYWTWRNKHSCKAYYRHRLSYNRSTTSDRHRENRKIEDVHPTLERRSVLIHPHSCIHSWKISLSPVLVSDSLAWAVKARRIECSFGPMNEVANIIRTSRAWSEAFIKRSPKTIAVLKYYDNSITITQIADYWDQNTQWYSSMPHGMLDPHSIWTR